MCIYLFIYSYIVYIHLYIHIYNLYNISCMHRISGLTTLERFAGEDYFFCSHYSLVAMVSWIRMVPISSYTCMHGHQGMAPFERD